MNETQGIALFYLIPLALWLALLGILFRVWWSHKLEDSLAYLVFLRERKVLFVSLLAGLTFLHIVVEVVSIGNALGWFPGLAVFAFGLTASLVGAVIVLLFGWVLLRGAAPKAAHATVLDAPEHLAYSLGVVDRAESATSRGPTSGPRESPRGSRGPSPSLPAPARPSPAGDARPPESPR